MLIQQKTLHFLITRLLACLFALVLCLSCSTALSQENSEHNIIALVGQRRLTVNDLKDALLRKFQSPARIDTLSLVEKEKCLNELVDGTLILNEA